MVVDALTRATKSSSALMVLSILDTHAEGFQLPSLILMSYQVILVNVHALYVSAHLGLNRYLIGQIGRQV